jgi:hypothetical protein
VRTGDDSVHEPQLGPPRQIDDGLRNIPLAAFEGITEIRCVPRVVRRFAQNVAQRCLPTLVMRPRWCLAPLEDSDGTAPV